MRRDLDTAQVSQIGGLERHRVREVAFTGFDDRDRAEHLRHRLRLGRELAHHVGFVSNESVHNAAPRDGKLVMDGVTG